MTCCVIILPCLSASAGEAPCGCGGIGRRVRFRSVWGQPHEGSSPFTRTTFQPKRLRSSITWLNHFEGAFSFQPLHLREIRDKAVKPQCFYPHRGSSNHPSSMMFEPGREQSFRRGEPSSVQPPSSATCIVLSGMAICLEKPTTGKAVAGVPLERRISTFMATVAILFPHRMLFAVGHTVWSLVIHPPSEMHTNISCSL
jgi:hypothetical protein